MKSTKWLLIFSMTILLLSACGTKQGKQVSERKETKVTVQKKKKEKIETEKMSEQFPVSSDEQSLISEEQINKSEQKSSVDEGKQKKSQEKKVEKENKEKSVKQNDNAKEDTKVENQKNKTAEAIKPTENAVIKDSNEAIQILQQYLHTENNEELIYSQIGNSLLKDERGQYYYIKEVVKKIKENGGSGTAGLYKIYEDGSIESNY